VVRLERERHVIVVAQHGFERRERAVVHVRGRELDVAQRRHAERELIEVLSREVAAAAVERRRLGGPGPELRHAGVREARPAESLSAIAASSFGAPNTSWSPGSPRISRRSSTGSMACALSTSGWPPGSPWGGPPLKLFPKRVIRPSQNRYDNPSPSLSSDGALRRTNWRPGPRVREGPRPVPPVPIDSDRPSPSWVDGWWQVAHATSRLPLRILSNMSA